MRPPRPSDVGTTSWSKALDLYLASYDASGHAEFSGGVSARVAPAAPLSGALSVSEPRTFRAPLALVDDNRADREIRRRLHERLTRGTRVSEKRETRAGAHPRAHALGWSRDSWSSRLDDARRDVSEHHPDARTRRAYGDDFGDRRDRRDRELHGSRRLGASRSPPPPVRGTARSASSEPSSPSPSASSASSAFGTSSSWVSSRDENRLDRVEGEDDGEEQSTFASSALGPRARERRRNMSRAIKDEREDPPVSPEARAAARVDALLAGLGVVVSSPEGNRTRVQTAAEPSRRIAPAPGSAPRAGSARGPSATRPRREKKTSGAARERSRKSVASEVATSPSSPSSSSVGGSDAESGSASDSSSGSTEASRSTAREETKHAKDAAGDDAAAEACAAARDAPARSAGAAGGSRSRSGSNPRGSAASPASVSRAPRAAQAPHGTIAVRRPSEEDLEDVSSVSSGSFSESGSEGSPASDAARRSRADFLAEEVRLSLAALEQIRDTHALSASPPESPGAAERAAARAARRARRESGELDAVADAAAATLFLDALEPPPPPPPASPSGLTGAARVRLMYPELFA